MAARTKITRGGTPDTTVSSVDVVANTGAVIGTLRFEAKSGMTTSVLNYAPGQEPHRTWPLKRKHRQS